MSTRLSSLLVQASVVSVKQIERALERQVLRGGQLDTNLLEIGVPEAAILPHLARARDLEPAARSVWPAPPDAVLALVPADLAQKSELAPLGKEGGRFYVLTHESFNAATLAELSSRLGLAVVPVIIPEFRVHEALSRYYGLPMTPRSAALVMKYPQSVPSAESIQADYPWATQNPSTFQKISASAISAVRAPKEEPSLKKTLVEEPHPLLIEEPRVLSAETPPVPAPALRATLVDAPRPQLPVPALRPTPAKPLPVKSLPPPQKTSVEETKPPIVEETPAIAPPAVVRPTELSTEADSGSTDASTELGEAVDDPTPTDAQQPTPTEVEDQLTPIEAQAPSEPAVSQDTPPEGTPSLSAQEPTDEPTPPESLAPPEVFEAPVAPTPPTEADRQRLRDVLSQELSRDELLREVLQFSCHFAPEVWLFQLSQDSATLMLREVLRLGRAPIVPQGISLAVAQVPFLRRALEAKAFLFGSPSEDFGLLQLLERFQKPIPASIFVLPILVKDRVVALFLGFSGAEPFDAQSLAELPGVGPMVSRALLSLLRRKKTIPRQETPSAVTAESETPRPKIQHGAPYDSDDMNTIPEVVAVKRPIPVEAPPLETHAAHPTEEPAPLIATPQSETAPVNGEAPHQTIVEAPQSIESAPPPEKNALSSFEALTSLGSSVEPAKTPETTTSEANGTPTKAEAKEEPRQAPPNNEAVKTLVEEEYTLDASDIQEEPAPLAPMSALTQKLAQEPVQEFIVERPPAPSSSPLQITSDLLRQTERLEKEHEALDTLAALIQSPKPKKAPEPVVDIQKLLDMVDLGTTPNGHAVDHTELAKAIDQLVSIGEAALAAAFALFPGRRLPKTPGVLRLEEGNLIRLLLRFGHRAVPGLKRLLQHPDNTKRFYAFWCLASMKDPDLLPTMLPGLFDTDAMVRQVAFAGVGQFAKHPVFHAIPAALRQALASEDSRYRFFASGLIGKLRLVELIPGLVERLEDSSPEVAKEAYTSLIALTFQDHGPKKKPWISWLEKHGRGPREAWLIEALSHKELSVRQLAFQELRLLTNQSFNYDPDGDKSERKRSIKQWEEWLERRHLQ